MPLFLPGQKMEQLVLLKATLVVECLLNQKERPLIQRRWTGLVYTSYAAADHTPAGFVCPRPCVKGTQKPT